MIVRLRVREVAREKGISQGKLSRIADVDIKTVSKVFKGQNPDIRISTLFKFANALGVLPCDLFVQDSSLRDHFMVSISEHSVLRVF